MDILAFFAGILFFYTHAWLIVALSGVCLFVTRRWRSISWFLCGLLWVLGHQWLTADSGLPQTMVIPHASISGTIVDVPKTSYVKSQLTFLMDTFNQKPAHARVMLTCYSHCPKFEAGSRWQFDVKLKKPHNFANPGAFDYETFLSAQHIHWSGYIKNGSARLLESSTHHSTLQQIRQHLAETITQHVEDKTSRGMIQALTLGLGSAIEQSQWALFRHTGTIHLMVISGAHVGLVASIGYYLALFLWRRSAWCCHAMPAPQAAGLVGVLFALIYALLSGFAVPAQRAVMACCLFFSKNFLHRPATSWQAWRYGLFCVILVEPHAVLQPGFYLSFGAVLILLSVHHRYRKRGIQQLFLMQGACFVGLLPMSLYWFSYGAVNGLIANLAAIPLVGYVIVPLSLGGLILAQITAASWIFWPAQWTIQGLLWFLSWVDRFSWVNVQWTLTDLNMLLALFVMLGLVVMLPIKQVLPASALMGLSLFFPVNVRPVQGSAAIDVLDVGQGLAVVVQTAHHTLLYDTGVKFYRGSDMGQLVILPYLAHHHIKKLDNIVISHPDLDHRGGLSSVLQHVQPDNLFGNRANRYTRQKNCHHAPDWEWDGVRFHFFPIRVRGFKRNNTSCVLRISTRGANVLLTGDIEKQAESYLVQQAGNALQADILLVAHHGSKTSSSDVFLHQVNPRYALISFGLDNQYHFPHVQTLQALEQSGVQSILNTRDCGMIHVVLGEKKGVERPQCYRIKKLEVTH